MNNDEFWKKFEETMSRSVENSCRSYFDDYIKINVKNRFSIGLSAKIVRKLQGETCEWCKSLAGVYKYGVEPKEVYQRHDNCDCTVEYMCEKGRQNVWESNTAYLEDDERRKQERLSLMIENEYKINSNKLINFLKNDIMKARKEHFELSVLPNRFKIRSLTKERRIEIIKDGISQKRPVFVPDNDILIEYSKFIKKEIDYYDVLLHGNPYYVEYKGEKIDVEVLCAIIAQRNDYQKGTNIRLISCETGANSDGVAQYIANKLNVIVKAPTTNVYVYYPTNGISNIVTESKKGKKDGTWKTFYPNKTKKL